MKELSKYSLDVEEYSTLITITGDITDISDSGDCYTITTDYDYIELPVLMHPKILDGYKKKNFSASIDDSVDILGTYIKDDKDIKILALRCVVYPKSPGLVS